MRQRARAFSHGCYIGCPRIAIVTSILSVLRPARYEPPTSNLHPWSSPIPPSSHYPPLRCSSPRVLAVERSNSVPRRTERIHLHWDRTDVHVSGRLPTHQAHRPISRPPQDQDPKPNPTHQDLPQAPSPPLRSPLFSTLCPQCRANPRPLSPVSLPSLPPPLLSRRLACSAFPPPTIRSPVPRVSVHSNSASRRLENVSANCVDLTDPAEHHRSLPWGPRHVRRFGGRPRIQRDLGLYISQRTLGSPVCCRTL